ncbi:ELO family [Glomus cerebriforme]|uniref:Elongation of fatty acids protein n=1 Tax=Glomus cerebriforme TaxID=658196 RepID=A0A397SD98_9GLOM|nr:ELO family [Glomus cerebriforme]
MNDTKNLIFRAEEIFSIPYNTSNWDYYQFINPNEFQWKVGITPFSNWQFIVGAWATYFVTIISLKSIMSSTSPFSMRYISAIHNLILCILSAVMFGYATLDFIYRYQERGIGECFCTSDSSSAKGRLFYVTYIYYLSKFDELLDTVILALKKRPIIFLHWYHHAIVILMVWSWLEDSNMYASIGMMANTLIHVFMYYYYFSTSLGRKVWFKKYITTGQIIQFAISFILAIPYLYFHFTKNCQLGFNAFVFSMVCNGSFLILFIRFYRKTYSRDVGKNK